MSVIAAVLIPVLLQALLVITTHGAPEMQAWPGAAILGPLAPMAPQIGSIAVGLLILSSQFKYWTVAFAALYVPGMLSLLQWLLPLTAAWLGYAPRA